ATAAVAASAIAAATGSREYLFMTFEPVGAPLVSRVANSLNKRCRQLTPYFVANPRQVSNLTAVCFASGANFGTFAMRTLLAWQAIYQRTSDSGH
ncbi:MAG: hypothetical protein ACRD3R_16325, partial [Terriglobales bacterium]